MQLTHSTSVLNFGGTALRMPTEADDDSVRDVTIRDLVATAVNGDLSSAAMEPTAKARAYSICQKLYADDQLVDLTIEDAALIKERAGAILTPLAYGRLADWLEEGTPAAAEASPDPAPSP